MRQTKEEMEKYKDECEEYHKRLQVEIMRREETVLAFFPGFTRENLFGKVVGVRSYATIAAVAPERPTAQMAAFRGLLVHLRHQKLEGYCIFGLVNRAVETSTQCVDEDFTWNHPNGVTNRSPGILLCCLLGRATHVVSRGMFRAKRHLRPWVLPPQHTQVCLSSLDNSFNSSPSGLGRGKKN
uniref:Uncharacterized protein n=1 Tax=Timema bartmani TaxID=61472 RepID=A0A7R9I0F7_9NEOP|nr:unnamed protein product [Timema bartmani]